MSYTDVNAAVAKLNELEATICAYSHAMGVLSVDASTAAPAQAAEGRGRTMAVLSGVIYKMAADPENLELVKFLLDNRQQLDKAVVRRAELLKKSCDQISRIPQDEYIAYQVLLNESDVVWRKAKNENDFASFAPILEQIVEFNRKFAGYYNAELAPYDALLNEYEEGLTMQTLDAFFGQLRSELVPLIHAIGEKPEIDDSFLHSGYDIQKQKEFTRYLMDVIGLDPERCTVAESEHPFTSGFNNRDVRITTHYYEETPTFSIFSVIHEGGHALYELGGADENNYTALAGGASMSIHESQSRFYENIVGRSREFVELIFPRLQALFPEQLKNVTAEMLYKAVNKAKPSLIRTEADELTYCMHIMVRYELEKQLIAGTLEVRDVPAAWNKLYKDYLGVDVPSDSKGCLQDTHWAGGMLGYFPSYALGSAYGAQMLHFMEQDLGPIAPMIAKGEIGRITAWLGEHIHRYGNLYKPGELLEMTCGEFDAKYYTDYLKKKYTALYEL